MARHSQVVQAMQRAQQVLRGLGALSASSRLGSVGDRASELFGLLDTLISQVPAEASDDVLQEVERSIDTLHLVDQEWPRCGDAEGRRLLDLAAARIRRVAQRLS